ncbi:MAG TPA: ribonuclease HII [Firmicutes bacterium]|nr:ribonuclease HII [Bacillota bacterium]
MPRGTYAEVASFGLLEEFDDRKAHPGRLVAGVDEAGRGPLAGPVVAAAVILSPEVPLSKLPGLADSKTLSPEQRERLFGLIEHYSLSLAVGIADQETIDRFNILQATLSAMAKAVAGLCTRPELVLVDGLHVPEVSCPARALVKGDQRSASVAAASIVAKVSRDHLMEKAHYQYPQYRFDRHKGYGTPFHLAALEVFGPSELHRRSFAPVAQAVSHPCPSPFFEMLYRKLSCAQSAGDLFSAGTLLRQVKGLATATEIYLLEKLLQYRSEEIHRVQPRLASVL